ncbi:hypothetical protein [Saccharothrix sp. HUAS TT1]|uniref:hypothetical protein n=1 Tax=unclassified Saccharothrix TaxID=2593673 RepID=UPI00345B69E7
MERRVSAAALTLLFYLSLLVALIALHHDLDTALTAASAAAVVAAEVVHRLLGGTDGPPSGGLPARLDPVR